MSILCLVIMIRDISSQLCLIVVGEWHQKAFVVTKIDLSKYKIGSCYQSFKDRQISYKGNFKFVVLLKQ